MSTKEIRRFLIETTFQHKKWIVLSVIFAICLALVQLQIPFLIKNFTDEALIPQDWSRVKKTSYLLVLLFFLDGSCVFLHQFFLRIGVEKTVQELRNRVFRKLLIFSHLQRYKMGSGKAVTSAISDSTLVGHGMHVVADLIRQPLVALTMFGYLFYTNWQLTLLTCLVLPFFAIVGKKLGDSSRRNQTRIQASLENISHHVIESVEGLRTAHSFGRANTLKEEYYEKTGSAYKALTKLACIETMVNPTSKWIFAMGGAALMAAGGYLVTRGDLTVGELLSFLTAAGLIQQPLRTLNHVNVRLQQVYSGAERIYEVLQTPTDEIADEQNRYLESPIILPPDRAPILEFQNVSFRYPRIPGHHDRPMAIQSVSLTLEPGKKLALVGPSGSGKSTATLLTMRYLDPESGSVLLGGRDAREWPLNEYRSHFSYVSQDVFVFSRSLRENLCFAKEGASDEELWAVLKKARLDDFVNKLPAKLNTVISEKGSNLSGGERQRLALARAFLRNAPVLILDEATSQLDTDNEKAIQEAVDELIEGRSVLMVAHRLATVKKADQIAVFSEGQLRETGSPENLLQNPKSEFKRLWQAQSL